MEEREALKRLKHREEDALAWFIDRYTAYVSTIVSNILGPAAASADLEAIASDVFFAFWTHAKEIRPGKAKAYLGSIARNKAKESTRKTGRELPLEDDMLVISSGTPERELEKREQAAYIRKAVLALREPGARSFCATTIFISRSPRLRRRWGWSPQMSRRSSSGAGRS
ncbi:MAG: RNA polymerase sigma factor [Acutalibacteraceae bacterium]